MRGGPKSGSPKSPHDLTSCGSPLFQVVDLRLSRPKAGFFSWSNICIMDKCPLIVL